MKTKFSLVFFSIVLAFSCLIILYGAFYFVWDQYYKHLLEKEGQDVVATIIRKENGRAQYDIEYEGVYYRRWILLSKTAYRRVMIGERYYALVLPDKLQYYHESGLTPKCFSIILRPLPTAWQDLEKERERIDSMYPL